MVKSVENAVWYRFMLFDDIIMLFYVYNTFIQVKLHAVLV